MSADNWAICPRCEKKTEFVNLKKDDRYNFRENYEIGVYKNKFEVDYIGSCTKCGFSYTFSHSEQIKI
jgi:hypothetical protein